MTGPHNLPGDSISVDGVDIDFAPGLREEMQALGDAAVASATGYQSGLHQQNLDLPAFSDDQSSGPRTILGGAMLRFAARRQFRANQEKRHALESHTEGLAATDRELRQSAKQTENGQSDDGSNRRVSSHKKAIRKTSKKSGFVVLQDDKKVLRVFDSWELGNRPQEELDALGISPIQAQGLTEAKRKEPLIKARLMRTLGAAALPKPKRLDTDSGITYKQYHDVQPGAIGRPIWEKPVGRTNKLAPGALKRAQLRRADSKRLSDDIDMHIDANSPEDNAKQHISQAVDGQALRRHTEKMKAMDEKLERKAGRPSDTADENLTEYGVHRRTMLERNKRKKRESYKKRVDRFGVRIENSADRRKKRLGNKYDSRVNKEGSSFDKIVKRQLRQIDKRLKQPETQAPELYSLLTEAEDEQMVMDIITDPGRPLSNYELQIAARITDNLKGSESVKSFRRKRAGMQKDAINAERYGRSEPYADEALALMYVINVSSQSIQDVDEETLTDIIKLRPQLDYFSGVGRIDDDLITKVENNSQLAQQELRRRQEQAENADDDNS